MNERGVAVQAAVFVDGDSPPVADGIEHAGGAPFADEHERAALGECGRHVEV